jgi:hypothetical protein
MCRPTDCTDAATQTQHHMYLTRCGSEVLDGLAVVLGAAQQHAVLACGALQGQLVKGQALTTSLCVGGGAAGRGGCQTYVSKQQGLTGRKD